MAQDWSEEQKEALERWAKKDPKDRHPHDLIPGQNNTGNGGSNEVTSDECRRMRQAFKRTTKTTIRDLVRNEDFGYSRETVARHVFNRSDCNHDIDEPPAEDELQQPSSDERVSEQECQHMREAYHGGFSVVEVKEKYERTYDQTYYHVVGRCKCENEADPASTGAKE